MAPLPNTIGTCGRERPFECLLEKTHPAVPAVCRRQVVFLLRHEIVNGDDIGKLLFEKNFDACVVQLEKVVRRIDAGGQTTAHAFAAIGMTRHLQSQAVRFIDDRLNLFKVSEGLLTSVASAFHIWTGPTKSWVV